ncbi:MAG: VWA domain-containing protein [Pseudomonadota bacterium]
MTRRSDATPMTPPAPAGAVAQPLPSAQFRADEAGGITAWSILTIIAMLMMVAVGIDAMRTETLRTHMQNTLDRAVLAAADLEQDRSPDDVAADYFERAGLPSNAANIKSTVKSGDKTVSAKMNAEVDGVLIDLIGTKSFPAIARGEARESVNDVEIALVLDNSGSMGWDGNRRLNLLKPAAKEFIDTVMKPGPDGAPSPVSVSIVPFSTQVNAGPLLGGELALSSEHNYSHCVEFQPGEFGATAVNPATELRRGGHFDVFTWNAPVVSSGVVCPFDSNRHITPFSQNADALKAQIDAMWAGGNTSIDIAAKWGAALLDPAFRPVVNSLVAQGKIGSGVLGRPYDFGRPNSMKVLVVMSDGQNTQEYQLAEEFRSGKSAVWQDPTSKIVSYFDAERGEYFVYNTADVETSPGGTWESEPEGGDAAVNLDWPEVWDMWSVATWARYIKDPAVGGGWSTHYDAAHTATDPTDKNTQTEAICAAFRSQHERAIIYTVGMDTYGQGDATLENCAGTPLNFFDVDAEEVDEAFSAIASQINKLRLTQ